MLGNSRANDEDQMEERRKSVCILALSPVARDARVLRQIAYLAPHYEVTVIGYGAAPPAWVDCPQVRWVQLPRRAGIADVGRALRTGSLTRTWSVLGSVGRRAIFRFTLLLGRCLPSLYDLGYALRWHAVPELADALARRFDAYHANDWDTVLLAARAARRHKAHLVVDLHEYAPLQFDHRRDRWLFRSMVRHVLRRHATQADAVLTVAPLLAERYREEFALDPIVVLNAPDRVALSSRSLDPAHVRLLHHGVASPLRRPEIMIETVARCDPRYTLHFMLLPSDYVQHLRTLAAVRAPGRVFFHDPVTPEAVVRRIAEFDVGLNVIAPTTYNYRVALPNKFFEGVAAGLAMCIGPSPSMAAVVAQYGLGCIAPSFAPDDLAATLNRTTAKQWEAMRQAAREAAPAFTAAREMAKVVQIYQRLFG